MTETGFSKEYERQQTAQCAALHLIGGRAIHVAAYLRIGQVRCAPILLAGLFLGAGVQRLSYDRLRGYDTVNLSFILASQSGWQVMLYDKNVFNTTAITGDFLNSDDTD